MILVQPDNPKDSRRLGTHAYEANNLLKNGGPISSDHVIMMLIEASAYRMLL